jgi:hypothetical protein
MEVANGARGEYRQTVECRESEALSAVLTNSYSSYRNQAALSLHIPHQLHIQPIVPLLKYVTTESAFGIRSSVAVEELSYKPEGRRFGTR